jgi:MerR family copper efflux transcriptional regulator
VDSAPIACTLTADAMVDRLAEWRDVFSTMVEKVERQENQATLTLSRGPEGLMTVADLAEREKACCSFFEFSIELNGLDVRLHVEVPAEAGPILTELLSLLPETLQPQ